MARLHYVICAWLLSTSSVTVAADPAPVPTKESAIRAWQHQIDEHKEGVHIEYQKFANKKTVRDRDIVEGEIWGAKPDKLRLETISGEPSGKDYWALVWKFPDWFWFQKNKNEECHIDWNKMDPKYSEESAEPSGLISQLLYGALMSTKQPPDLYRLLYLGPEGSGITSKSRVEFKIYSSGKMYLYFTPVEPKSSPWDYIVAQVDRRSGLPSALHVVNRKFGMTETIRIRKLEPIDPTLVEKLWSSETIRTQFMVNRVVK